VCNARDSLDLVQARLLSASRFKFHRAPHRPHIRRDAMEQKEIIEVVELEVEVLEDKLAPGIIYC